MSLFFKQAKKDIELYENNLNYHIAKGHSILEFCLSADIFYKKEIKDLKNTEYKELKQKIIHMVNCLDELNR